MDIGSGTVLGHYEILDLLGKGGMGEVWRARDTRLKRQIALKVLPPEMASDPERLKRFQKEAETVAGLNNPHIVTLHSVEEENDVRFLTMELVDGQSLDRRLAREGLPLEKIFQIGIAVADALAAAHERQIVHRDLKPANIIMGRGGTVKVLDFGLAKLSEREERPPEEVETKVMITAEGVVMGTLPYMSPEQVRGDELDHRSDIFSFGVVLYELVTGRRPFAGRTSSDLISSILRDTPVPIQEVRPETPRHLIRIIEHCLEKDPDQRTQSALDIRNEMESLRDDFRFGSSGSGGSGFSLDTLSGSRPAIGGRGAWIGFLAVVVLVATIVSLVVNRGSKPPEEVAIAESSIAVLPFVDMSPQRDQEYFSDGISEELLNLLAKIPELQVAARTSSFTFKGRNEPIPEVARKLGVAYVLEGSVRKSGSRVRVTAQLIHGADGYHLWSETWDRELGDIFSIQDDIASDVVEQLRIEILGTVPKVRQTDPEAYALYLQARDLGVQLSSDALAQSDALIQRVLEIDPDYAPAWDQLARNFNNKVGLGLLPPDEGYAQARLSATMAIKIDPGFAPPESKLGWISMVTGDPAGAVRHFERALELDPGDPNVLAASATLLDSLGRPDEALALRRTFVRRDPVNVIAHYDLGLSLLLTGRLDEAIESWRTVLSLSPGRPVAHFRIGEALLLTGDASSALAEFEQETSEPWQMVGLPMAYHVLGRRADSDAAIARLIEKYERDAAYNIAYVHAFRGEADRAFEWLDKAVEYHDPGLFDIVVEPMFAEIRNDQRWLPFLRRIGKAPEQLVKIEFEVRPPNR